MTCGEFNQMPIRIAHHCEVADHTTNVRRRLDENILFTRQFGDAINFCARVALKAKMIETRFYFVLHYDQNEKRVLSLHRFGTEPNVMSTF